MLEMFRVKMMELTGVEQFTLQQMQNIHALIITIKRHQKMINVVF